MPRQHFATPVCLVQGCAGCTDACRTNHLSLFEVLTRTRFGAVLQRGKGIEGFRF